MHIRNGKVMLLMSLVIVLPIVLSCDRRKVCAPTTMLAASLECPIIIDQQGKIVKMLDYADAQPYVNGYAAVKSDDNKWGFVDIEGNEVIAPIYEKVHPFFCDRAVVERDNRQMVVDDRGSLISLDHLPEGYLLYEYYGEGLLAYKYTVAESIYLGFIDVNGYIVAEKLPITGCPEHLYFENGNCVIRTGYGDSILIDRHLNVTTVDYEICDNITENLTRAYKRGFGYVDSAGKWIIAPEYSWATRFSEGLAFVQREADGDYECINEKGNTVFWLKGVEILHGYFDGRCLVRGENEKYYYIDREGKKLFGEEWYFAQSFQNGFAWVAKDRNDCRNAYLIDINGRKICGAIYRPKGLYELDTYLATEIPIEPLWPNIYPIEKHIAVSISATVIIDYTKPFDISTYKSFGIEKTGNITEGMPSTGRFIYEKDEHCGICDGKGRIISPSIYDSIILSFEGCDVCWLREKCVFISHTGRIVSALELSSISQFCDGIAVGSNAGKLYLIDINGRANPTNIAKIGYKSASTQANGRLFIADRAGNVLHDEPYYSCEPCNQNLYIVSYEERGAYFLVDNKGRKVSEVAFSSFAWPMPDLIAMKVEGGKWGYVGSNGETVIPFIYDDASAFYGDIAFVRKGRKSAVIRRDGSIAVDWMRIVYMYL